MIDMREIYVNKLFQEALEKFNIKQLDGDCTNVSECKWKVFKKAFLEFANSKCPICEKLIDEYSHIDHYRPKDKTLYPFLECCYQNYMLMCPVCNSTYKKTDFPLYGKSQIRAKNKTEIVKEYPLIINPMHDDIYELFELHFINTIKGKSILILNPREGLDEYKKAKAEKTIAFYGIGNCDNNDKMSSCRIDLLEEHYERFLDFAKLSKEYLTQRTEKNKKKLAEYIKDKPNIKKYGFYKFIIKNQFKIAV